MSEGRWVLLIASEVGGTDSVSDRAMERLVEAIRLEGYEVVRTSTPEDGLSLVTSDPSYSTILLDWDLEGENQFAEGAALAILRAVRRRNKKFPSSSSPTAPSSANFPSKSSSRSTNISTSSATPPPSS